MSNIEELIKIFKERKRPSMKATPFSLYFLNDGKDIARQLFAETRRKPEVIELLERIKFEWKTLPDDKKILYFKAASELGFNPKELPIKNENLRNRLEERTNAVKKKLSLFTS